MTTLIKHKRVEFSELFYDLVFVFAISKVTTLIDHLHNGILTWNSFLDFFIATLFLIDSWMIQTDYTNRYGKNSLFNMVIMFIKMGLLLFVNGPYNKHYLRYSKSYYCVQATLYLAALILSLIFASNPIIVVSITTILALAIAIHFIYFYMTQNKKYSTSNWDLF